jgi:glycosyltransferase involved in cell wall biosynthesis
MPRVSVVIPTFNCAGYLGRALRSALSQSYRDFEILVVDDGSTDDTRELVAQFGDAVRYFHRANGGLSAARNLGLSHAGGELIAYLDADDLWYPQRLEEGVRFLDAHAECGVVHSEVTIIDAADAVIHQRWHRETGQAYPEGACVLDLLERSHVYVPTVLERRACIERVGVFDERLKSTQDYLHWIRIAMEGMAFGYIAEPLALYRRTGSSLSSNPRRVLEDYVLMFETLLAEGALGARYGQEALEIAQRRLFSARRDLAYLDRVEGRIGASLRHSLSLLRRWPLRAELYVDVLKASVSWAPLFGSRSR